MNTNLLRQLRPAQVIRETDAFRATRLRDGRVRIASKMEGYTPQSRRVSVKRWNEIAEYPDNTFDMACMFDLVIGVYPKGYDR